MMELGSPRAWVLFLVIVLAMIGVDLGIVQRKAHVPSTREALGLSLLWIGLACAFGGWVAYQGGAEIGTAWFTAYVVEKSLSIDNLFVFILVFGAMKIPDALQHRVLFWGILGALALRAAMIFAGTTLLHQFHWLAYVFGGVLVIGGLKLLREWWVGGSDETTENRLLAWLRPRMRMTPSLEGEHFFVRHDARWMATPLFGALVLVEASDIVFAVDSIPAALAISDDPFVVYTSNVFAVLGLRSLYFLLARVLLALADLKMGVAAVLVFVGLKMLAADVVHVPSGIALGVIALLLGASLVVALVRRKHHEKSDPAKAPATTIARPGCPTSSDDRATALRT